MTFSSDGEAEPKGISASYFCCMTNGCLADADLSKEMLDEIAISESGTISLMLEQGQRVEFPLSMNGFGAEWAALNE
ncbi:invasion associated locus B family protein [Hoeflea sp.]|uniref:invasion associated locus B family protein n=1 Tax=Hoeflea sp. TaxID=1940281 RepID=UPI003B517D60